MTESGSVGFSDHSCVICLEPLATKSSYITVERGLDRLIECCEIRGDVAMSNYIKSVVARIDEVKAYTSCRKAYTDQRRMSRSADDPDCASSGAVKKNCVIL
jgi:hypothetical protein